MTAITIGIARIKMTSGMTVTPGIANNLSVMMDMDRELLLTETDRPYGFLFILLRPVKDHGP